METIDLKDPQLYADWTYDELDGHIKALQELKRRKGGYNKPASKKRLTEMLDPKSDDFMGSGMRLDEWWQSMQIDKLNNSFHRQERPEKERRLRGIIRLSSILVQIEDISIVGTAHAQGAIQDVIEGDWSGLRWMTERDYWGEDTKYWRDDVKPLWESFRLLLKEVFDTRPGAVQPPPPKN